MDDGIVLLTKEDEQEFLASVAVSFCPECGTAIEQKTRGRKKKFCSDACRFAWKNKHPNPKNWKSTRVAVCPICGKEFLASREYQRERKYCSRACANKGRAAEKKEHMRETHGAELEELEKVEGSGGSAFRSGQGTLF